ncbi:MAG: hypothetical protein AAFX87_00670 [Bacteroidota bacterium]
MEYLNQLTPAETKLIMYPSGTQFRELLKLTFADLVLKGVLKVTRTEEDGENFLVSAGKNFEQYSPQLHEAVFLSPFIKSPDIEILLRHLIAMARKAAYSQSRYKNKYVAKNQRVQRYFGGGFFSRLFGSTVLSEEGERAKVKIAAELKQMDRDISPLLASNPKKAMEVLAKIGGNVLLLESKIDFEVLKKYDKESWKEEHERLVETSGVNDVWLLYMASFWFYDDLFYNLDGASDSFDTSYDEIESASAGGTGCGGDTGGGDSGCSGCSGCGGCGGCGG